MADATQCGLGLLTSRAVLFLLWGLRSTVVCGGHFPLLCAGIPYRAARESRLAIRLSREVAYHEAVPIRMEVETWYLVVEERGVGCFEGQELRGGFEAVIDAIAHGIAGAVSAGTAYAAVAGTARIRRIAVSAGVQPSRIDVTQ